MLSPSEALELIKEQLNAAYLGFEPHSRSGVIGRDGQQQEALL